MKRIRAIMLMILLFCCLLAVGCSNLLDEGSDSFDRAATDGQHDASLADEDEAVWQSEESGNSAGEGSNTSDSCYTGEQYIAAEGVCALSLGCVEAADCELWGDEQIERLLALYGSFVDVEGIELTEAEEALSEEDEQIIVTYPIEDNELLLDGQEADEGFYEELWQEFAWIIPQQYRWMLTSFSIFSHVDTLAYVVQEDNDWESWSLGVNIEPSATFNETIGTLTHEFGHLLFLNKQEVDPYGDAEYCDTIYIEESGCLYDDSYIYAFKTTFWQEDEYEYSEDEFVTEYAAGHIDEDMAESWMYFVLAEKPAGDTVAEQKVLFFYQYDELVMLRAQLLSRIATFMDRV